MENDDELVLKFTEHFEKLKHIINEKEKFENTKNHLLEEIENAKRKIKVLQSSHPPKNNSNSEIEKKEKELYSYLKSFKEESEALEKIKLESQDLKKQNFGFENELYLIDKNIEELYNLKTILENEIDMLNDQLSNTQNEIEFNGMKYKELIERLKKVSQVRSLKIIEIENLLEKYMEIKKTKKVNQALLKNQEISLENAYKGLVNKNEETNILLASFLEIANNNEKLQIISKKYIDKVSENNKIREENESLKEKINIASVKNFQNKLQNFSPVKKQRSCSKEYESEKLENIKVNMEKIKRLIVDINIIQNKK